MVFINKVFVGLLLWNWETIILIMIYIIFSINTFLKKTCPKVHVAHAVDRKLNEVCTMVKSKFQIIICPGNYERWLNLLSTFTLPWLKTRIISDMMVQTTSILTIEIPRKQSSGQVKRIETRHQYNILVYTFFRLDKMSIVW